MQRAKDATKQGFQADDVRAPALAGIATHAEAARIGLTVEESVACLHRYAYLEAALTRLLAARVCGTPEWEVKGAAALHAWYDAEHAALFQKRVSEMRNPPPNVFKAPTPELAAFADELVRPHSTVEYLIGIYGVVRPALLHAYRRLQLLTNPIAGHPTVRLLRMVIPDEEEALAWGQEAIAALVRTEEQRSAAEVWREHLEAYLAAAGGVDGDVETAGIKVLAPRAEREPFEITVDPVRDHAGAEFPYDLMPRFQRPDVTSHEAAWAEMYDRVREMDAVEMVAPLVAGATDKPWEYVRDMARQLWDETRHSMMGEVGFERVGADWRSIPIPVIQSRAPNTHLTPAEVHLVLWDIEQSMMPRKTGKGYQRDIAEAAGNALGYQNQDYDWADEVLHVQIGRRWLLPEFGSRERMREVAEACSQRLRDAGMDTAIYDHEACNWWDDFYREICRLEADAGPPEWMTKPAHDQKAKSRAPS